MVEFSLLKKIKNCKKQKENEENWSNSFDKSTFPPEMLKNVLIYTFNRIVI